MEIQLWREILHPYEQAVTEIVTKLECLRDEFIKNRQYAPIEQISGRVKTVASILDKMQRKQIAFEHMQEEVEDIGGVRIICQFVEDIETVARLIESRTDMTVVSKKDYLANKKKSGYRSYHLIVLYPVETVEGLKKVQVEIQIRTLAMNFWATTEHSLQYKYQGEVPQRVSEELERAADAIFLLDNEMSQVRSEIIDAQIDMRIRVNLVKDILNSIENLFYVASAREVQKIQDEFLLVYKKNDINELTRFQKQLDLIAEGYRAQSVDQDIKKGSKPNNYLS